MQDILIYGAGGHATVTIDLLEHLHEFHIKGVLDDTKEYWGKECMKYPILGGFDVLAKPEFKTYMIAIGIANPQMRETLFKKITAQGFSIPTLIHPTAYIGNKVIIKEGAMILPHAVINIGATIGTGAVVNTAAIVEHECKIGSFVHIAPGVHLGGKVVVKDGTLVGIGATILPYLEVGEHAIVGGGAVVITNVAPQTTVVGNPAHILEKNHDSHR